MERCLEAGRGENEAKAAGRALYATVGLDFGTSCSKVVVRFAYEPGSPAIAIPAPGYCCSGGDPYLWQTVIWVRSDGTFLPWPEAGATPLHSLKQGLVEGRPNEIFAQVEGGPGATRLPIWLSSCAMFVVGLRSTDRTCCGIARCRGS